MKLKRNKLIFTSIATAFMLTFQPTVPISCSADDGYIIDDEGFEILNGEYLISYMGTEQSEVTVPESVTMLGEDCFSGHSELKSITLPDGLELIEKGAFTGCSALESLNIPDQVTVIESYAFGGCSSLKELILPPKLESLNSSMFQNCSALKSVTIQTPVKTIPNSCFQNCTELEQIQTPDTVTEIQIAAFSGCNKLYAANTQDGFTILNGHYLLSYSDIAERRKQIRIPDGVTVIADHAINDLKVYEITCPSSLQYIGAGAFYNCQRLVTLNLNDGLLAIGANAISNDQKMESLTIPESVKTIGEQKNINLKSIYGTEGTEAEAFAVRNGIPFNEEIAAHPNGPDMTLDFTKDIWSFGNSGKVFGSDYYLNNIDRQKLTELGISTNNDKGWGGSCLGLSVTVILAKNGMFSPEQLQSGTDMLSEIKPTENVLSFINYYQWIQGRAGVPDQFEQPIDQFYRMIQTAKNVQYGESPFLLTFALKSGSHAVVGYGQESGEWAYDGKTYDARILIWDSNYPSALHDNSCLYYDSETFDYCIPQYGVHVAEGASDNTAGIITVCNDLDVLNAYPYPFELHYQKGDVNYDGAVSVADAVLLCRFLTVQTELTDSQMMLADVSGDKKVNAADLTLLKRILLRESARHN